MTPPDDPRARFIEAAIWHGPLQPAEALRAAHPEIAGADLHTAAILGDDAAVRRFLEAGPAAVHTTAPPYGGDALNYLCLSRYLRLDPSLTPAFLRAAAALLDAGADPNTGVWKDGERETALYGAAGVAHHPGMTRLLLERGADPNDVEAVYHSPETYDNRTMRLLVDTGRVTRENLSLMLIRKHDWHDRDGVRYLLERGVDPNLPPTRGRRPLHHALARDNALEIIDLLLDRGADPGAADGGFTAVARAARLGRGDVLASLERRGIPLGLTGLDALLAACARGDAEAVAALSAREPHLIHQVRASGGELLARFALTDNPAGLRRLLDLGVPVDAPFVEGDGYFGIPGGCLAIHVAAWMLRPAVVRVLLEAGSPADPPDP
ncbi:MAG TPA: ankyrin repeat domain-containing protein, partial [Gemmatimonadales bacterium]|nr:ankyrin repeat domain-containing protein [Gemmatimonadales bacterium]